MTLSTRRSFDQLMPLQKLSEKCYQTGRSMSSFGTVHKNVDGATGLGSEIPFHINGYEAVRVYEKPVIFPAPESDRLDSSISLTRDRIRSSSRKQEHCLHSVFHGRYLVERKNGHEPWWLQAWRSPLPPPSPLPLLLLLPAGYL